MIKKNDPELDFTNEEFINASQIVLNNEFDVMFLTGKAGTGKSTFIKYIKSKYKDNLVILSYTGVAATNVEGQTIHSFFKLPFEPILPDDSRYYVNKIHDYFKYDDEKKAIIENLTLLIIDEISMVRCDLMDIIDEILKVYRNNINPFGGVKLLLVGDLFQLPPIVSEKDNAILTPYYGESFYFFNSEIYKSCNVKYIELLKVYRQKDDTIYMNILDRIRTNEVTDSDIETLNRRKRIKCNEDNCIYVFAHNSKAQVENHYQFNTLSSKVITIKAEIEGNFMKDIAEEIDWGNGHKILNIKEHNYFVDMMELKLKVGAKVIVLKNNFHKGYYSGLIGVIKEISYDYIIINTDLGEKKIIKEVWEKYEYKWDNESKSIKSTVVGTFSQFPLKMAWALTIHKCQGLTFDNMVLDLQFHQKGYFGYGLAYVAVSRCRSLDGLYLINEIKRDYIIVNENVITFTNDCQNEINDYDDYYDEYYNEDDDLNPDYDGNDNDWREAFDIDPDAYGGSWSDYAMQHGYD
jgi:hypothetical protein